MARTLRHHAQRGDHVVGLVAGHLQAWQAQGVHHLPDAVDLCGQICGRLGAARLVALEFLVPKGLDRWIEHHDYLIGTHLHEAAEDSHEAQHGVGGLAARVAQRRQREVRAVRQRVTVDQDDGGGRGSGHGGIVPFSSQQKLARGVWPVERGKGQDTEMNRRILAFLTGPEATDYALITRPCAACGAAPSRLPATGACAPGPAPGRRSRRCAPRSRAGRGRPC